jgi:hypothetical protein
MAKTKPLPPRDFVRQMLDYDPETGVLIWRRRPGEAWWNKRYAGTPAGSLKPSGRLDVAIGHTLFRAHRLIWLMVHGDPVPEVIDHADKNKSNNRLHNLRAATKAENGFNSGARKNNTTGIKGVGRFGNGRFRARVTSGGKDVHLGYFATLAEAAKTRREAAERLHGEFVRHE